MMLKALVNAAVLAGAMLAGVPAVAQEKLPDIRVRYGDLDLTTEAGARMLDRRLAWAAREACPSENGVRDLARLRTIRGCRNAKRAEASPARAAALAAGRTGSEVAAR